MVQRSETLVISSRKGLIMNTRPNYIEGGPPTEVAIHRRMTYYHLLTQILPRR